MLKFVSQDWFWVEQDNAVLICAKNGEAKKVFVIEGANSQVFFQALLKGVSARGIDGKTKGLVDEMEKYGLITQTDGAGEQEEPLERCPEAEGISLKVHDLEKILPSEIRVLTVTQRFSSADGQGAGTCSGICGAGATGCAYDVKLHFYVMSRDFQQAIK